jgi:hypothetical protein
MATNEEVTEYCKELFEEVSAEFPSYADGATPEQVFTDHALQLLAEAGETENYRVCYDEKQGKRGTDHKINAYSLYENYETLDLFITIYVPSGDVQTITKVECEKAFRRLTHFFRNTINKGYVNEIEESSEIYDLAHTLYNVPEVKEFLTRINLFIVTNGEVHYEYNPQESIAGFQVFNRIIDITYLYNISTKAGLPIEIDFQAMGHDLPCISTEAANGEYKSYLAIIPGLALSTIYEQYGPRLLEQNVRSFLQFTGKINKGIRKTIIEEPHMFFAFNNGLAATADEVTFVESSNGGKSIGRTSNFQIVNGGQTTASIYHTWKKHGSVDIAQINIPLKLTILNDKAKIPVTVGRIAECANTQNKVSASDLSSNREGFVLLDNISRAVWAPPRRGTTQQTRWFFERARGQYRNERNRNGYTLAKRKAFDLRNPRSQLFTKEQMAKYINSYCEISKGSKCVIGPHHVVRGNQKNYVQFLTYNFRDDPDPAYFEDTVAKAILFTTAEKIYGVKPNSIGELRYITVPYTISWLSYKLENRIDLYRLWQTQGIPDSLEMSLRNIMVEIEQHIKTNAPGDLYGEWAKKEDCWISLKAANLNIDFANFEDILITASGNARASNVDVDKAQKQQYLAEIKELGGENWKKIYLWCKATDKVPLFYTDMAHTIGKKVQAGITLTTREILAGYTLLNDLAEKGAKLEKILQAN